MRIWLTSYRLVGDLILSLPANTVRVHWENRALYINDIQTNGIADIFTQFIDLRKPGRKFRVIQACRVNKYLTSTKAPAPNR
jgi:hypothetical protein